jgi:hypothetical protein
MKKLLVLATLVAATSAFSQGTVVFNNRVPTAGIDARVTYGGLAAETPAGTQLPFASTNVDGVLHPTAQTALYGGPTGTAEAELQLLVPAVAFRGGSLSGYLVPGTNSTRFLSNCVPGGTAVVQMRAWDAMGTALLQDNSYKGVQEFVEDGLGGAYYGASGLVNIGKLGGTPPPPDSPIQAPNLVGLTGFAMDFHLVPEPSMIGLGILGAFAGLIVFRRRN